MLVGFVMQIPIFAIKFIKVNKFINELLLLSFKYKYNV